MHVPYTLCHTPYAPCFPCSSVLASAARRNMLVSRVESVLRLLQSRMDHIDAFIAHYLQVRTTAVRSLWQCGCIYQKACWVYGLALSCVMRERCVIFAFLECLTTRSHLKRQVVVG